MSMLDLRRYREARKPAAVRAIFASTVVLAFGCSEVKRETVDRFKDYDETAWTGAGDCEDYAPPADATSRPPRIGAWNIRYFPDSQEGPQSDADKATDVPWLSCAVASLGVDVLAVQEIKQTPESVDKQRELVDLLNSRTGGDWQLQVAGCAPNDVQHPGFLYDASRVTGEHFREVPLLNPDPVCSNDASPGFAGYFRINGGPDFHLVSVHMHSGSSQDPADGRAHALSAMPDVIQEAQALVADNDVFFAGDFNTSGCENCSPSFTSEEEIASVVEQFDEPSHPLRLIPASERCSREDGGDSPLLDHIAATDTTQEVGADPIAVVSGICAEFKCDRMREWHEDARERLSDHCPVLLDLAAADQD